MPTPPKDSRTLIRELQATRDEIDSLNRKADQSAGALKQIESQMKADLGCSSKEEGEKLLTKLYKDKDKVSKEADETREEVLKKHGKRLEEA